MLEKLTLFEKKIRSTCLGVAALFWVLAPCGQTVWASLPDAADLGSLLDLGLRVFVAGKPIHLILVEKDKQRLRVLKHDGRLRVIAEYQTATGENAGQKEREGDAKTPEGIYFITKIYTDTKVTVFGKRAFHLDYPNVFDRQEGKGGTGIFVHGTNKELTSNSTNGCIALNNNDLEHIVEYLPLGTVPVVVVSSLADLSSGAISDMAVKEFVANHFQQAREALGPYDANLDDIVFESLYMITTNSQTVAVGEYQRAGIVGTEPEDLVRGYLKYSPDSGWAVIDTVRKISAKKIGLLADSRVVSRIKPQKLAAAAIVKAVSPDSSLWPDPANRYLTWYRQAVVESAGKEKPNHPLVQHDLLRVQRSEPEFAILFFFSLLASIGSGWLLVTLMARRQGVSVGANGELEQEKHLTTIARIKKDITWSLGRLAQLKLFAAENENLAKKAKADQREDKEAVTRLSAQLKNLAILEEELSEKGLAIEELTRNNQDLQNMIQKVADDDNEELLVLRGKLHDMAENLQAAAGERQRLSKRLEKLSLLEEELSAKKTEIDELLQEKQELHELLQKKAEYRDELEDLRGKVNTMAKDLLVATKERQRLGEKLSQLSEVEIELAGKSQDIVELRRENQKLSSLVEDGVARKDEIIQLRGKLDEMTDELQIAIVERQELVEQAEDFSVPEKRLPGKGIEEVIPPTIDDPEIGTQGGLPVDVLKQWIGG